MELLEPPSSVREGDGRPAWYGSDDEVWGDWERTAR